MRQGPHVKRPRGRNHGSNGSSNGSNVNGSNNALNGSRHNKNLPLRHQTFDSNGPDIRVRGNAYQVFEKYLAMARDATAVGDRVAAENYFQHAEHYFRINNLANEGQPAGMRNGAGGEMANNVGGEMSNGLSGNDGEQPHVAYPDNAVGSGQHTTPEGNGELRQAELNSGDHDQAVRDQPDQGEIMRETVAPIQQAYRPDNQRNRNSSSNYGPRRRDSLTPIPVEKSPNIASGSIQPMSSAQPVNSFEPTPYQAERFDSDVKETSNVHPASLDENRSE